MLKSQPGMYRHLLHDILGCVMSSFLLGKVCDEAVNQAATISDDKEKDNAISDYIYIQNILHPMKVMKESSV